MIITFFSKKKLFPKKIPFCLYPFAQMNLDIHKVDVLYIAVYNAFIHSITIGG